MAASDIVVNQASLWVGVIGAFLTIVWLLTIRVNRKGVYQSKIGNKSLQSDRKVVGGFLAFSTFCVITAASLGYASYALLLIPILLLIVISRNPETFKPLWRGIKKVVIDSVNGFINLIASIFKGVTRK